VNDTLRRAFLRAQLSEDDIAALLAVDPKTVRRWTEGRIPYLRHRWELARLLGCDETDLWPQVSTVRSRPEEVWAVYPRRDTVPSDVWRNLFGSAEREISILARSGLFLARQSVAMAALGDRAQAGVEVRICVRDPATPDFDGRSSDAVAKFGALRKSGKVQIRVHRVVLNNAIYRADDEMLVGQYVYGIPAGLAPILHMRRVGSGDMVATYLESFEQVWAGARRSA
jgi:transcriptional regulator with XRE-family HTH domain